MNMSLMSFFSFTVYYNFHIQFKYDLRMHVNRPSWFNYERQFYNFLCFINICNLCKIRETIIKLCYVLCTHVNNRDILNKFGDNVK